MLFAFAVSTGLYKTELAYAPFGLPENSQIFLPNTNGRIAFST